MKKVLFVMNTMGQGGAETALLELLRAIDKASCEVSLYVLTGQGEMIERIDKSVKLLNKSYNAAPVLDKEGRSYLRKTVLRSLFRRANIIRLFPYLVANLFRMIKKGKVRADKLLWRVISDGADRFDEEYDLAVSFLEGGSAYYVADHVKAKKKAAFIHVDYEMAGYSRKLDRDCYLKDDMIFGVSDEVKEAFVKVYPECREKCDVFHNLINISDIREKAGKLEECSPEWKEKREKYRLLLTVGRLTEQKALDVSIRALKIIRDRGYDVCWFVLGEGDRRGELEALVSELGLNGLFVMPGVVKNPYPYIKQAEIYVHCSRFEGKSIAIQEAQVLGKPMLVSDCSGNREQVIPKVDGLMCNLNEEEIAENIIKLLDSEELRSRLGQNAARKLEGEENMLSKLYSLME